MYDVAPLYVEFHMVRQTGIQPKACSIEVYVYPAPCVLEITEELASLDVLGVYAVVVHAVFIEGKTVEKIWACGFFACPKWVHRGKKIAAQKIWIVTLSFSDGDFRPLVTKY